MRTKFSSGFSLLELITVMAIIAILAGIVIGITGHTQDEASRRRAQVELMMFHGAIENYRSDTGTFPQTAATDAIDPKVHFNPVSTEYAAASLALYQALTGDVTSPSDPGVSDGVPEDGAAGYLKSYDPRILMADKDPVTRKIIRVHGFQDPWGYYYGYSTAHLAVEQRYQAALATGDLAGAQAKRPSGDKNPGYNVPGPDMWSTAKNNPVTTPTTQAEKNQLTAKWVKDW